ncbi:MAG: hypothetical protein LBT56_05655 [Prevotellaceae bacterium]|nr:hypothetical protein [Prevotellaceae bacterium]
MERIFFNHFQHFLHPTVRIAINKNRWLQTYGLQYERCFIFLPSDANLRLAFLRKTIFYRLFIFCSLAMKINIYKR